MMKIAIDYERNDEQKSLLPKSKLLMWHSIIVWMWKIKIFCWDNENFIEIWKNDEFTGN